MPGRSAEELSDNIAQDYARSFQYLAQGRALYLPPSSHEMKPGAIGYFDWDGGWNQVANITEPNSLSQVSLTGLAMTPEILQQDKRRWEYPLQGGNLSRTVLQSRGNVE